MSTTFLLIVHGLLAVALLGAVTHQAVSVWLPMHKTADSFVGRVRAVQAASYATAIIVLYLATATLGWNYLSCLSAGCSSGNRTTADVVG